MRRHFLHAALLFGLLLARLGTNAEPVRLAIVSSSPETSVVADVLTAELSSNTGVQLLERNEVSKVYSEQALASQNPDYIKIGKILGADGVLEVQFVREGTNSLLSTKLIAVNPGVVLFAERYSTPPKAIPEWASGYCRHLVEYLPKLSVTTKDAVPISLVSIRSALRGSEQIEKERLVKLLAIERLTREPRIFVLERSSLQTLGAEKEMMQDESPFWNGRYLMEILIDAKGFSKETVCLSATVTPRKGEAPFDLEASGARTNLQAAVDTLVQKLNEALNIPIASSEWNADDEAERFFAEAMWAFKWEAFAEAREACESSWALGKQDEQVAALRINTYLSLLGRGKYALFHYNLPTDMPTAVQINYAKRVLDLQEDALRRFCRLDQIATNWSKMTYSTLDTAVRVLEESYKANEIPNEDRNPLAELRAGGRALIRLLENDPETSTKAILWLATQGCLLHETPEEAISSCNAIVKAGLFHKTLDFYNPSFNWGFNIGHGPIMLGWSPSDRERAVQLWRSFIDQMRTSSNSATRLGGEFMRLRLAEKTNPEGPSYVRACTDAFVEAMPELLASKMADAYMDVIITSVIKMASSVNALGELSPGCISRADAHQVASRLKLCREKAEEDFRRQQDLRALRTYLRSDTNLTASYLGGSAANVKLEENEKQEVLQLLQEYEDRVRNAWEARPRGNKRDLDERIDSIRSFARRINGAAPDSPAPVIAKTSTQTSEPSVPATNALTVSKFWTAPFKLPSPNAWTFPFTSLSKLKYRQDKLWLLFDNDEQLPMVCSVQLSSLETEAFKAKEGPAKDFEVLGSSVYLVAAKKLYRASDPTKNWNELPIEIDDSTRLKVEGDHLLLTGSFLAKLSPDGQSTTLLASERLNPPAAIQQTSNQPNTPKSPSAPQGEFRVRIGSLVYSLSAAGKWVASTNAMASTDRRVRSLRPLSFSQKGTLLTVSEMDLGVQYILWQTEDRSQLETLVDLPIKSPWPTRRQQLTSNRPSTRWTGKELRPAYSYSFGAYEHGRLWLISKSLCFKSDRAGKGSEFELSDGSHLDLVVFEEGHSQPITIPLLLNVPSEVFIPEYVRRQSATSEAGQTIFHHTFGAPITMLTPDGLVIGETAIPGFWFIPQSDLEKEIDRQRAQTAKDSTR